jgi:hypothetical protein
MVGWEWRGHAGPYFYKSVRDGKRVRREYYGKGLQAQLVARELEHRQTALHAERQAVLDEMASTQPVFTLTNDMDVDAKLLLEASMLAAGYGRVNYGRWRKHRDSGNNTNADTGGGDRGTAVLDRPDQGGGPLSGAETPGVS